MEPIMIALEKRQWMREEDDEAVHFSARIVNWRVAIKPHAWRPPTDLIETDKEFIVRMEIAGMQVKDFTISYDGQSAIISGTRWTEFADCAFHQMEIPNGEFSTEVDIPSAIEAEHIQASYENGFLDVVFPKAKTQEIKIKQ